jgi:hypothetical protein
MRVWLFRLGLAALFAAGGLTALSLGLGQEAPSGPAAPAPSAPPAVQTAPSPRLGRDLSKLPFAQRQIYLGALRGSEWLTRVNRVDGRFQPGVVTALCRPVEPDHYLRQAGAAFAVVRAARYFQDDRGTAIGRQAVLTLLLDTEKDPRDPQARRTIFAPAAVSRLGAAGLLLLIIHELPDPGDDLLTQSDELCQFLRRQQRPDGALGEGEPGEADGPDTAYYAGLALYGLVRSQQHRPADWKLDVLRKARAYYQARWRANKQPALIPPHTAAYAEAYLLSKEHDFADCVLEMNDWLCTLQYEQPDPRQLLWQGGFKGWADGKPAAVAPGIESAAYAESLADACRVARETADIERHPRYLQALERCLQFLLTLQFTEGNAQHFADWYRKEIQGGFYASHQDGTLRLDYAQHAVCALVQYLGRVAEVR